MGKARRGAEWHGRLGMVRRGRVRSGRLGVARFGVVRLGWLRRGAAGQAWCGWDWLGWVGTAGKAAQVTVWRDQVRFCTAG